MINYVARQPIFDREQKVFAYELLYRSGSDNFFSCFNGDRATIEVIANSILLIGLNTLTSVTLLKQSNKCRFFQHL